MDRLKKNLTHVRTGEIFLFIIDYIYYNVGAVRQKYIHIPFNNNLYMYRGE
ncbi:hypothetical protein [Defluviitalea raffinosedens]|uniref:hypothetical protein n=1 Tax=Defluviitalea raffinosedens TaxID=1450156 RepID=UPI00175106FD|nr:hypothetical protein [Defluviitalea raffinosedens]HHW68496.1 hypothetical protein [Candidatus Epulonipiscium sp.]